MNNKQLSALLAIPALMMAFAVQAHSEKEHMEKAENPDCATMNAMDHSKMDMSDPVVMAMMQQCMNTMQQGTAEVENTPHGHGEHMTGAGKASDHMQQAPSQ
ncbi:hypothetical protein [Neptunomonas sp.]|jgi:hypothetical protein|uniref:hypothetical protein n=1 Tax=Neptunomonas sp. TaxID=1971898 RepID=UPI0025D88A8E|nr:hypothetical protein [Neptunomonas sp.]